MEQQSCDVFNAFLDLALSGRDIVFALRMLVRGGNSVWQMGEYVFLWHLPSLSHLNRRDKESTSFQLGSKRHTYFTSWLN